MSATLLYHAFGVRNYHLLKTEVREGVTTFHLHQRQCYWHCSACGSEEVASRGNVVRTFKTVPIGSKPVLLSLTIPRVVCLNCQTLRQVTLEFANPRRSYTKQFEQYALQLCQYMTMQDVARHLQVSWDVIKEIQKQDLEKRFKRPKLKHLRHIAIDEIAVAKGHKYVTLVLDLKSGIVVFVGDGKGASALKPFWKRLKKSRAKIEAVAMDMSVSYISAVSDNLPKATIVFDHFHVVKLFNDKIKEFRRDYQRQLKAGLQKDVLKGVHWLLLKNPENLKEARNEKKRLEDALALNKPLATIYYLKEDLRQLWHQTDEKAAEDFLMDWIKRAYEAKIPMLKKFANTLSAYRRQILSYYRYRISTGPLEGTNNKIKTMKRQAYGFRDLEFFKLKILALHNSKYALVG